MARHGTVQSMQNCVSDTPLESKEFVCKVYFGGCNKGFYLFRNDALSRLHSVFNNDEFKANVV